MRNAEIRPELLISWNFFVGTTLAVVTTQNVAPLKVSPRLRATERRSCRFPSPLEPRPPLFFQSIVWVETTQADTSCMLNKIGQGLLQLLSDSRCSACDLPLAGAELERGFCSGCALLIELAPKMLRPPAIHAAAAMYRGPMADAVRRFKYAKQSWCARSLSRLLVEAALGYAADIDVVVPMPLHPERLRQRGWNPSALLAREVARALGVRMRARWLTRVRATAPQAGLSADARAHNVAGAFKAARVPTGCVLLIDDVRTTGATLLEAARSLEAVGHQVRSLVLAYNDDTIAC